jgi:uncharacterized protein YceK
MKFILLCCTLIILSGCSSSEKRGKVLSELSEKCKGTISTTVTLTQWGDSVSVKCEEDKTK